MRELPHIHLAGASDWRSVDLSRPFLWITRSEDEGSSELRRRGRGLSVLLVEEPEHSAAAAAEAFLRGARPEWPLADIVQRSMQRTGTGRGELARRLGYRNANKGCRQLDRLIADGLVPPGWTERLPEVFGIELAEVAGAAAATSARLAMRDQLLRWAAERRRRAAFRPHLWRRTDAAPRGWLRMAADSDLRAPGGGPCREPGDAGRQASADFAACGGRTRHFGAVTGYLYRWSFDEAWRLSTGGDFLGPHVGPVPFGS